VDERYWRYATAIIFWFWPLVSLAVAEEQDPNRIRVSDLESSEGTTLERADPDPSDTSIHHEASFQEEPPRVVPRARAVRTELPLAASEFSASLFGGGEIAQSMLNAGRQTYVGIGANFVVGPEAVTRSTTDAGSLLGKSPSALGLGIQRRNPIVTDPRIRGSRVGRLAGSGSYWVPARMDLDTALSKIDSRIISDVITVKGPYAARYGPGFSHIDFELLPSPRYSDRYHSHGLTAFDYKANGDGWYGRQMLWGGADDWGFRAGYGHRTGNDYASGDGQGVMSSYNSRTFDLALGRDLSPDHHVEFKYLRLDQTGVELPGQAFDIDVLFTDGYELAYVVEDPSYCDQLGLDLWYNRTRFDGSAPDGGKLPGFPVLANYYGNTDVDSMSTGFRLASTWGCQDCERLTAGVDLRYVKQELNEITSGRVGASIWNDANSPIPRSYSANPGLFLEYAAPVGERLDITAGARVDLASTDVVDDPAKLLSLGTQSLPLGYILGTDDLTRTEALWATYITGEYIIDGCWTAQAAAGYAERSPSLTELYAAETFMFVLQNGLNTVTGDPRLKRERLCQVDLSLVYDNGRFRGGITGFYGWAWDYITYENVGTFPPAAPPGIVEQVQLKYVNTDLATLAGAELHGEFDLNDWLTPFATFSYMDGRDRTRNGDFATIQSSPGNPSNRDYTRPRGFYSGIGGGAQEALPSIVPLESRLGIRLHQPGNAPAWSVEMTARLVDNQDCVATSLLETPTSGFTVWDLRGYLQATERLLLVAGVENIGDRTYREHLDFRTPSGVQVLEPGANFYFGGELTY